MKLSFFVLCNSPFQESYGGGGKLDRKQLLLYLIYMLYPVLKKVNRDLSIEIETKSKAEGMRYFSSYCKNMVSLSDHDKFAHKFSFALGKELAEIRIPQIKLGIHTSFYWYIPYCFIYIHLHTQASFLVTGLFPG